MSDLLEIRPRTTGHHPACLKVRWIQLRASEWHNAQWNKSCRCPAFQLQGYAKRSDIRLQTNWEPTMPMPIVYRSTATNTYSTPASSTTTGGQHQTITPAPAHQPAHARQPRGRDQDLMANNTAYKNRFMQFSRLNCRLRDVVGRAVAAGNNLPNNGDGTRMCLSYHIKGKCNTGC